MKKIFSQRKNNRIKSLIDSITLKMNNKVRKSSILSYDGPIVSLTTFGSRLETVYLTIESIARGKIKPSEIILWLDQEEEFKKIPKSLERLKTRGLKINFFEKIGPHSKYYPTIATSEKIVKPLVTADDDVMYPNYWLKELVHAHKEYPKIIHCYRAHRIIIENDKLAPYKTWIPCKDKNPSLFNFATGVSGVIYPIDFQKALKAEGDYFKHVCPKADDIWLHMQAVRHNFLIRQLHDEPIHFVEIPSTRKTTLNAFNVKEGGNDIQIAKTYTQNEINILQAIQDSL